MTKIVKAKYKASRRLGVSIWGDGKDPYHKRNYRPGQHGQTTVVKTSDYGIHLRAKQRLKNHYGRITEKQFRNIFKVASKIKGNTEENFVALLESRLDTAVYRSTIGSSIFASRQLVSHGHILVNGKKINIPSYKLQPGDEIEVKESSKQLPAIVESVTKTERTSPDYYSFDKEKLSSKFVRTPGVSDVPYPFEAEVNLVVEYYSK